ncbi:hypothetical protein LguiA_009389 [Lonicera macranthoides]
MELPQSRPLRTQGRKSMHDFLSLYSPTPQDPRSSQGAGYLKTHDFLQPLEQVDKSTAEEENKDEATTFGKSPPSGDHHLPGGIGTYSISHISCINQRVPIQKPEPAIFTVVRASSSDRNDDQNSNCSSYTGSGFTLWEESAGKTGKENIVEDTKHVLREDGVKIGRGQWTTPLSSSSNKHHSTTFNNVSYLQPLSADHKNQSFTDMIKAAKSAQEDEDDDDEDEDDEFVIKKEPSSHQKVKLDRKGTEKKPNTPRSKHSATEQRRRSKINDRFQTLRELIPHSDQKRDRATFLLEVIEYIQFLQEKANKYDSFQGWNHEQLNLMPLRTPKDFVDQSRGPNVSGSALMFAENSICAAEIFKETDQHPRLTNKPPPLSVPLQQPQIFSAGGSYSPAAALPPRLPLDVENRPSQPLPEVRQNRSCTTNTTDAGGKPKDQELTIESGTAGISSVYSQGLLNTLTKALKSSGVDLSRASISVQVDLGKRANSTMNSSTSNIKDGDTSLNQAVVRSRLAGTRDESEQILKRLKTRRS